MPEKRNWAIIRKPTLMEDEGRSHLWKVGLTKQEALDWIAAQKDEYFRPSDYMIQQAHCD